MKLNFQHAYNIEKRTRFFNVILKWSKCILNNLLQWCRRKKEKYWETCVTNLLQFHPQGDFTRRNFKGKRKRCAIYRVKETYKMRKSGGWKMFQEREKYSWSWCPGGDQWWWWWVVGETDIIRFKFTANVQRISFRRPSNDSSEDRLVWSFCKATLC